MGFLRSQLFVTPVFPASSFAEQTVIVTGSNVGLGKEAARHLVRLRASKVILAVRNTAAGEEARREIVASSNCDPTTIEVWSLDLASFDSVKAFAVKASKLARLDVLLENAGIAKTTYSVAEGHEQTITVNVISTFLLALLLLPKLKATAKTFNTRPRITVVSSEVHAWAKFPEWKQTNTFATLDNRMTAQMSDRYQTSKLLIVLVVRQLAPMLKESDVIINMVNPGLCKSSLAREGGIMLIVMKFLLARTTEVGSRTLLASASAGEESHGSYMSDCKVDNAALSPFVKSKDGGRAAVKIWSELCGILEEIQPGVTKDI